MGWGVGGVGVVVMVWKNIWGEGGGGARATVYSSSWHSIPFRSINWK